MTKTVFKLLIQTETLEPARQDKDQMEITCSREKEVILEESGVDVGELYLKFIDYLCDESRQLIGAVVNCGFGDQKLSVAIYPGKIFHFTHWETFINDEGEPEKFAMNYALELEPLAAAGQEDVPEFLTEKMTFQQALDEVIHLHIA